MVQIFYYAWKYRLRYFRNNDKSTLPQRYRAFMRVRCTLRLSVYAYMALMGERHVRIEISDFVMRTFVPTGTTVLQGGIKNACNVLTCMDTAGAYFAAVKCKKAGTKPEYRVIFG